MQQERFKEWLIAKLNSLLKVHFSLQDLLGITVIAEALNLDNPALALVEADGVRADFLLAAGRYAENRDRESRFAAWERYDLEPPIRLGASRWAKAKTLWHAGGDRSENRCLPPARCRLHSLLRNARQQAA